MTVSRPVVLTVLSTFLFTSSLAPIAKAGASGNKEASAAAKPDPKPAGTRSTGEPAKTSVGEAATSAAVEAEIERIREMLEAQNRELHAQQQRIAALEAELRMARTNAPGPASETSAALTEKLDAVAQNQDDIAKKIAHLEGKFKQLGPFTFSGDFRLRSEPSFGGPTDHSQQRFRERYRLRFNADAKLNDEISGGFTLASGDINDPISTNQTTNQFYARKPFFIDRAFINYQPRWFKPLKLTGGKFSYPWRYTELTWDKDLNPEGVAQTLSFDLGTSVLKKVALVGFELPFTENTEPGAANKSIFNSVVYGGQLQTEWELAEWLKFSADEAYYGWHDADPVAFALVALAANFSTTDPQSPLQGLLPLRSTGVQNSIATVTTTSTSGVKTITSAQFASKFGLLDTIARFDVKTSNERWPLVFLGDFVQNTRACGNLAHIPKSAKFNVPCNPHARRGYWLEGRTGRTEVKGDWAFSYTRIFIEREAVLGAFNYSEIRQNSNVAQHRVEAFYQAYSNVQLQFTGFFGRPLVTHSSPREPFLKRLQFDVIYKF
jgi:hypothetical protein